MQTQAQISFDDISIDDAVRDAALEHIDQLESFYDRITVCHVVIAQFAHPHHHALQGHGGQPRDESAGGEAST